MTSSIPEVNEYLDRFGYQDVAEWAADSDYRYNADHDEWSRCDDLDGPRWSVVPDIEAELVATIEGMMESGEWSSTD